MLGGTYFYYCTETSTKHKQVFRYRYLSVKENERALLGKDQHPVFLMINDNAISVYISPPPHQNIDTDKTYHLLLLFSIPLYPKGSKLDKLTEVVIYLYEEKAMDVSAYTVEKKEPVKDNKYIIHSGKGGENELDYKVIFQHFLYDLSFSDVFQNATHHDEAMLHLRENYFVNCIIAKAENKYWKDVYSEDKDNQQYIQTKYWEADRNWVNLIVEEKSNELLEVSDWFKGAEQELQEVLESEPKHRIKLLNTEKNKNRIKEIKIQRASIYHFFLQRFNTLSIECYLFRYNTATYIFSILLLGTSIGLLLYYLYAHEQQNFWLYLALLMVVVGIMQGVCRPIVFMLSNILSRKHINYYNHSLGYPRMSLAIMAIWLGFIPVCEEAWKINLTLSDLAFNIYASSFVLVNLVSIFYFVNDVQYGNTKGQAIIKSFALFSKGMFISMAFGVFAMEVSRENIFSGPSEFLPKEYGILEIDTLSETIDSLKVATTIHLKVDSTLDKSLDSLGKLKVRLIHELANQHVKNKTYWKMPSIAAFYLDKVNCYFFIFPKLLFTYSAFAFFIGLFVQVAFQGSSYREHL